MEIITEFGVNRVSRIDINLIIYRHTDIYCIVISQTTKSTGLKISSAITVSREVCSTCLGS